MVEEILKVISRELSVVEVMQVFKGEVKAAQRLQPGLFNFVKDKLLNGATPTMSKKQEAVKAFLANVEPSLRAVEVGCCVLWCAIWSAFKLLCRGSTQGLFYLRVHAD